MSLLDRLVPRSALSWGKLTSERPQVWWVDTPSDPPSVAEIPGGHPFTLAPDPAAAWGEADRRAEGEQ